MERIPITLDRVELETFIESYKGKYPKDMKLINIRGCNGAGKSTIPLQLLQKDRGAFIFTVDGKDRATCFPSYGIVAIGRYKTRTGGMDGISTKLEKQSLLQLLWYTPFTILMEGVIDSTIYSTYVTLFNELKDKKPKRDIGILNLLPPIEVALERVQLRNGGKAIDEKAVLSKWNTVNRNADKFRDVGFNSWKADNSQIEKEDTLDWFNSQIANNM